MPRHGKLWTVLPCRRNSSDKRGVTFTRTTLYLKNKENFHFYNFEFKKFILDYLKIHLHYEF
jgi:hypothetical protein